MAKDNIGTIDESRRNFLKQSGVMSAGLTIGFYFPLAIANNKIIDTNKHVDAFKPNAWVTVLPNNRIKISIAKYDSGTATHTALAACVCDELDADLEKVHIDFPKNPFLDAYKHQLWGVWSTGGSTSIHLNYKPMRRAGAIARVMLIEAAAQRWGVAPQSCSTKQCRITHAASGRSISYGEVAAAASQLPIPKKVELKKEADFKYIGKIPHKVDALEKTTGRFRYGIDLTLPGMVVALITRSPMIGDRVLDIDASDTLRIPGVQDVIIIPGRPDLWGGNQEGVAVLANDYWSAHEGRSALKVRWRNESPAAGFDSDKLPAEQAAWLEGDSAIPAKTIDTGNVQEQWAQSQTVIESDYLSPYKSQSPMEPMNITASIEDGGITYWGGVQVPSQLQEVAQEVAGIPNEKIKLNNIMAGGSFGTRQNKYWLFEVTYLANKVGRPVKLMNSREDEMRGLFYNTATLHRVKGALDEHGNMTAIQLRAVSARSPLQWQDGYNHEPGHIDYDTVEGISEADFPYRAVNMDIAWVAHETGIPTGWYRANDYIPNVFAVESFMGEMAHSANRDPLEFRLAYMQHRPRHVAVLRAAAERAGWHKTWPSDTQLGIAIAQGYGTYAAVIAQVKKTADGVVVKHLTCVADCGLMVSRKGVREQIYGGLVWGMGHVLYDKIDIKEGKVVQNNFNNYLVIRMSDMPTVDIEVIEGDHDNPTGVGELTNPLVAPAVANAVFRLTGERHYSIPLKSVIS